MNFACSLFPILLICFITNVPSSTSSSSSSSSALSSSDVVSSSAAVSSSDVVSSSAVSSSDVVSSSAMSSSAMSSSAMSSSSVGNCMETTCDSCFTTANCSWDFAQNLCVEDATSLPYPFNGEVYAATSAFCPMADCLFDFQHSGYAMLQQVFTMENKDNIANFSACLGQDNIPCDGTMWVGGDSYTTMCANISNSAVCDYNNDLTWTVMVSGALRRLRKLLSSSSSSSEMSPSGVSSSSAMSPSGVSSSSAMSPSGVSSSSAMSPSDMSSSEMSPSQMPSSSSLKTAAFKQAYCQPNTCADSDMLAQFSKIFKQEFNFDLLNQTAFTQMPRYTCPNAPTPASGGLSGGAIAGIIIGVLVGVLLFGFLGWNMCGKKDGSQYQKM